MGAMDKIKDAAQENLGKAKQSVGEHTGDDELVAEGQGDQVAGNLKGRGEHLKDAFKG